ncbi:MAG: hypothetical protein DRQ64_08785, partial [Gammaproteobacteria bacterium]
LPDEQEGDAGARRSQRTKPGGQTRDGQKTGGQKHGGQRRQGQNKPAGEVKAKVGSMGALLQQAMKNKK